jgi:hypothetical protein
MIQADRVHSTPPTNMSPTRRNILGTIAAAATAIAAKPVTAAAIGPIEPDPIFAVIERHRKACREHHEAVDIHMDFEESDMEGEKLEKYNSLVAATAAAYDDLEDAGLDLINTRPATLAGIFALCQYIKPLFAEDDAPDLPTHILYDDDTTAYPAEAFAYVIGRAAEDLMKAAAGKAVQS